MPQAERVQYRGNGFCGLEFSTFSYRSSGLFSSGEFKTRTHIYTVSLFPQPHLKLLLGETIFPYNTLSSKVSSPHLYCKTTPALSLLVESHVVSIHSLDKIPHDQTPNKRYVKPSCSLKNPTESFFKVCISKFLPIGFRS